ncbi:hypothetical protein NliqN6_6265 [Naganishia liquefaciens]|uniref:Uncharacterized protein n=1 Tax=Naganishia liquefaciens TaxID=104408 RepID=A0A8H3TZD3_9TREE|nr:hypothetical protein NliqN6_6265 [Naganishia liquefaciens]
MILPHTPLRHGDHSIPVSPVVLEIERRLLFTPGRVSSSASTPVHSPRSAAPHAATYSPRPDDFYFEDGAGGHVTRLELPDDEKHYALDAVEVLADIRRLEAAIEDVKAISLPLADNAQDPMHIERVEQSLWEYLAMLEEYRSSRYGALQDACMDSVQSPQRRNQPCVPPDKVTLYALGVAAEMAINTLREECHCRLEAIHASLYPSARPDDDDLVVTVEDKSTTSEKSSTPIATPTRIPVSASRRQPLGTPTSEQRLRMTGQQKARRSQFSESLDDTVRRVADEVLERSPTKFSFQPNREMKVWSDGMSGMCTFTYDGKTASAYCRMWQRDTTLRVSVVVGGGFQSLDEWLERTFKRYPSCHVASDPAASQGDRKACSGMAPPSTSIPVSSSMPSLSTLAGTHGNKRISSSGLPRKPFPASPSSISRQSSMLRDVSASSTYRLSNDLAQSIENEISGAGWAQDSVVGPPGTPSVKVKFPAFQAVPR